MGPGQHKLVLAHPWLNKRPAQLSSNGASLSLLPFLQLQSVWGHRVLVATGCMWAFRANTELCGNALPQTLTFYTDMEQQESAAVLQVFQLFSEQSVVKQLSEFVFNASSCALRFAWKC